MSNKTLRPLLIFYVVCAVLGFFIVRSDYLDASYDAHPIMEIFYAVYFFVSSGILWLLVESQYVAAAIIFVMLSPIFWLVIGIVSGIIEIGTGLKIGG